jgi:multicomponent Na+:H+ antiporter subunit E
MRIVMASSLFAATWLLWSGHYSPLLLAFGALSCALVAALALRTGFFAPDVYTLHLGVRLPRFWLWLLREIVRSNFAVARIILSRRMPIAPEIVTIDAAHVAPPAQATLANSITLTPGTLCLDVHRGRIEVHCLTRESAEDLRRGEMLRRISAISAD